MIVDLKALHAAVASGNPDANAVRHQSGASDPRQSDRAGIQQRHRQRLPDRWKRRRCGRQRNRDAGQPACICAFGNASLHMEKLPAAAGQRHSATADARANRHAADIMFQEDAVALRCVLRTGWAKRRTGCTALATSVTW